MVKKITEINPENVDDKNVDQKKLISKALGKESNNELSKFILFLLIPLIILIMYLILSQGYLDSCLNNLVYSEYELTIAKASIFLIIVYLTLIAYYNFTKEITFY